MSYKTYEVRVYDDGSKDWRLNNQLHREDGPAIENADGNKEWYLNGELHRENGPAIEWINGYKSWWLNNKELSEKEFNRQTKPQPCNEKVIEMDGKEYKLVEVK